MSAMDTKIDGGGPAQQMMQPSTTMVGSAAFEPSVNRKLPAIVPGAFTHGGEQLSQLFIPVKKSKVRCRRHL